MPQGWIRDYSYELLREAGIGDTPSGGSIDEGELENFMYEAGEREWDESDDGDFYYIDYEID